MMYSGWIGLGMIIGAFAAVISLFSLGSVFFALVAYSLGGSIVVLSGLGIVTLFERLNCGDGGPETLPEIAHAPLKRAA